MAASRSDRRETICQLAIDRNWLMVISKRGLKTEMWEEFAPELFRKRTDDGLVRTTDARKNEGDEVDVLSGVGVPAKDARISHARFG